MKHHLTTAILCMAGMFGTGAAQANPADAPYLKQWLAQPSLRFESVQVATAPLHSYYATQGYQPAWVDAQGLTPKAQAALAVIANANAQGLNSELYAVDTIRTINMMPRSDAMTALQVRLSLEVLMSHAVMHYAADMHGGNARHQWDTGKKPAAGNDKATLLAQAAASPNAAAYLNGLEPKNTAYSGLKGALSRYQTIAANGGWPSFRTGTTIKPGMADARVPMLRHILLAQGDIPAITASGEHYDATTVEAVKRFQKRHGITADGAIGPMTQEALSVPLSRRIEQIAMTMERIRWMPADLGTRYVLVNIPAYELTAVHGDRQMQMDVIVGKPNSPTPMFSKNITNIVLNPSWGVPSSIAVKEVLPKLRKDPGYLSRGGYTVVDNSGAEVDPYGVDWNAVGKGNLPYSFRQAPGDANALGKVKFSIPNSDSIYLHDTAKPQLFANASRALSYGCVRLSDPQELTRFVLEGEGWNATKIATAYNASASRTVAVTPLPVHIVYWTSWVDTQGNVHFGKDIYGKDKQLLAAMGTPNTRPAETITLAMN